MRTLAQILRLLVLASLLVTARAQVVSVPDPGLNAAILAALGKPAGRLTVQDMLNLTGLSAYGRGITSLEGLEAAHNLTYLGLSLNQLTNFSVSGLTNLTSLGLDGNSLSSLSLPADLTSLVTLDLEMNPLTSLILPAGGVSLCLLLVAFAIEGVICLMMAAPIMLILAILGASVGYLVQRHGLPPRVASLSLLVALLLAPLLIGAESATRPLAPGSMIRGGGPSRVLGER
jgi:Leucine-rich repeat (LRR) protein